MGGPGSVHEYPSRTLNVMRDMVLSSFGNALPWFCVQSKCRPPEYESLIRVFCFRPQTCISSGLHLHPRTCQTLVQSHRDWKYLLRA